MANHCLHRKSAYESVAVYGTLKSGCSNHSLLADSLRVDEGWILGLSLYHLGLFPAATRSKSEQPVFVEVYAVSKDTLEKLDHLEDFDPQSPETSLYVRTRMRVEGGTSCWIYLYNRPVAGYPLIEDGIWPEL